MQNFYLEKLVPSVLFLNFHSGSLFTNSSQFCQRNLMTNVVIWACRVRTCSKCQSEKYVIICTHISSAYIAINRFSSFIYTASFPRRLLDTIQIITLVKSSKYFLSLKLYIFYCAYFGIGRVLRESFVYPLELYERWEKEYKSLQTTSERNDWVTQKVEEREAINAVRVMKRFKNSTNPLLCTSMPNFAKNGQSL
jgi:hypothetical protein